MSLKTEPKGIPLKNGDCLDCGGLGFTGMYHDRCLYCDGTGKHKPVLPPPQSGEKE